MSSRFIHILYALLFAIAFYMLIVGIYQFGGKADETTGRILVLLGAGSMWGIIQFLTYFLFFWCNLVDLFC